MLHADEILIRGLGQAHGGAPFREPVTGRDEQVDPLIVEFPCRHVGLIRQWRGEAHVDLAIPQPLDQRVRASLDQREPHSRVLGAEVPQQPGHRVRAQRVQEPERDSPASRVGFARETTKGGGEGYQGSFGRIEK